MCRYIVYLYQVKDRGYLMQQNDIPAFKTPSLVQLMKLFLEQENYDSNHITIRF